MLCKHCKTENPDNSIYCMGCGMPLEQPAPAPVPLVTDQKGDPYYYLQPKLKKWRTTAIALIALSAVLLVGMVWALIAYADQSDYADSKREEAWEWRREYNDLVEFYDLEGRYAIEIKDIYNGTEDDAVLDRDMKAGDMDCLHFSLTVHTLNNRWPDDVYADVYDPSGERMFADRDRAFAFEVTSASGSSSSWDSWFRDGSWQRGTYTLVFYQGDAVIHIEEIVIR